MLMLFLCDLLVFEWVCWLPAAVRLKGWLSQDEFFFEGLFLCTDGLTFC